MTPGSAKQERAGDEGAARARIGYGAIVPDLFLAEALDELAVELGERAVLAVPHEHGLVDVGREPAVAAGQGVAEVGPALRALLLERDHGPGRGDELGEPAAVLLGPRSVGLGVGQHGHVGGRGVERRLGRQHLGSEPQAGEHHEVRVQLRLRGEELGQAAADVGGHGVRLPPAEVGRCGPERGEPVPVGHPPVPLRRRGRRRSGARCVGRTEGGRIGRVLPRRRLLRDAGLDGQPVDEVVHRVVAVALHPLEGDLAGTRLVELHERLPQVAVRHRLALAVLPAVLLPVHVPAFSKQFTT